MKAADVARYLLQVWESSQPSASFKLPSIGTIFLSVQDLKTYPRTGGKVYARNNVRRYHYALMVNVVRQ